MGSRRRKKHRKMRSTPKRDPWGVASVSQLKSIGKNLRNSTPHHRKLRRELYWLLRSKGLTHKEAVRSATAGVKDRSWNAWLFGRR